MSIGLPEMEYTCDNCGGNVRADGLPARWECCDKELGVVFCAGCVNCGLAIALKDLARLREIEKRVLKKSAHARYIMEDGSGGERGPACELAKCLNWVLEGGLDE